ncbi:hypothetical protein BDY19DRAFT_877671, partial [Irpex rosettiformis]
DIPAPLLGHFARHLRRKLSEFPEFEDVFFVHEYRGLKGVTCHDGAMAQDIFRAYDALTDDLDMDQIHDEDWWVDIGMEICSTGKVLQWAEQGHGLLVEHLLSHLDRRGIRRLMKSQGWATDTSALLYDFAGFRAKPGSYGTPSSVRYINVYTTDKESTYQLHTGSFRRHSPLDILPDAMPNLLRDVTQLTSVYRNCLYNAAGVQEGCARVEVRVPLSAAYDRLRAFPRDLASDTIVVVDAEIWWEFKYLRTAALRYVFDQFHKAPPTSRLHVQALRLGALSIWMLNANIYRPGDYAQDKPLFRSCALQ